MRAIMLLLALSALSVSAESPLANTQTARICSECIMLTPAEVEQEKAALAVLLRRAFEAGRHDVKAKCASLI